MDRHTVGAPAARRLCLVGAIATSGACARSEPGAPGIDADERKDRGVAAEAAPAAEADEGLDASMGARVGASAFPDLGDAAAWSVNVRPSASPGDIWFALAQRDPRRPTPELRPWPDVRIALLQARDGGVERVATTTVPAGLVACDVPEGAMSRAYALEIDESHEGVVPGVVVFPLRVTCDIAWMAAESDDQWLVLWRPKGPTLEPILNVHVAHADYDRVKDRSTGVSFDLVPAKPADAGLARLCLRVAPPAPGSPAGSAHRVRGPGASCYDWTGTTFVPSIRPAL